MFMANSIEGDHNIYIRADRVVYLSKGTHRPSECTRIRLDTGEILSSWDSMKTLSARIERVLENKDG